MKDDGPNCCLNCLADIDDRDVDEDSRHRLRPA